jgi:hypothetical protein
VFLYFIRKKPPTYDKKESNFCCCLYDTYGMDGERTIKVVVEIK